MVSYSSPSQCLPPHPTTSCLPSFFFFLHFSPCFFFFHPLCSLNFCVLFFVSFFYEKSLEKVDQNIFVFHEILRFVLCCCGDEHEGGNDDEASHGLFSGSGSSNSSNVGTRYVWSWDRVFGRLSIPGPSRPGIAIYNYNSII